MSRGYRNYDEVEPYTDGWGNTAHSGTGYSDHVCRPVFHDAEGNRHPIVSYSSGYNAQAYAMKAERVVEHISHAAPVSPVTDYTYRTDEPLVGLKRYAQRGSAYNRPEKVENFLDQVQNAVSPRTRGSAPFSSNWRPRPMSTGKDGIDNPNLYGDDSIRNRDKQSEVYPQLSKGANPIINNNKDIYYERPIAPSHPLSKPTNDIGSAVDFLAGAIKPNYGNNTPTDVSRPIKAGPLSSTHWRTGANLGAQDREANSDDQDDWKKPEEQQMYGKDKIANYRVPANPLNNKEGNQNANGAMYFGNRAPYSAPSQQQQQRFTVPRPKEMYPPSETIDSSEARKRYGKLKNEPVPEDAYMGTIDSNEAVKRYSGAKVPW